MPRIRISRLMESNEHAFVSGRHASIRPKSGRGPAAAGPRAAIRYAVLALVLLLLIGFVALGIWQLERRTWKLALIERVDRRVHAVAVDAPGRERWPGVSVADDEYRHVRVGGRFIADHATWVQAVTEYGRGYWLMAPLQTRDGDIVLINRGFVATADRSIAQPASSEAVVVTGLLRVTEPHGNVLHDNDPAHDRWYSRDVEAIARARGLGRVAPYFIDADGAAPGERPVDREPIGGLTVIAFRNDHLLYAITWFVLAALCAWALRRLLVVRGSSYEADK